eukprot:GDKK01043346.1.p1 GENE.GDKK01043346.1~~GDKK01043346.1.p1  ORF type:complete len:185 (-),score=6.18 GDKK01043346.1:562-1116(-)
MKYTLDIESLNTNKEENLQKINYSQKILEVKRVAKTTKGGRMVTYRALVIVGNGNNKIGIGIGCADESSFAIKKAFSNAKQNLIAVPITKTESIPCQIKVDCGACAILLSPNSMGSGIIANGPIKTLMSYAGIKNVTVKQFGSNNILNNVKLTIFALKLLKEKIELIKAQSNINFKNYTALMKI